MVETFDLGRQQNQQSSGKANACRSVDAKRQKHKQNRACLLQVAYEQALESRHFTPPPLPPLLGKAGVASTVCVCV